MDVFYCGLRDIVFIYLQRKQSCMKWRKRVSVNGRVHPIKSLLQDVYNCKMDLVLKLCIYFLFLRKTVEIVMVGGGLELGSSGTTSGGS